MPGTRLIAGDTMGSRPFGYPDSQFGRIFDSFTGVFKLYFLIIFSILFK